MQVLSVRNAHKALPEAVRLMKLNGVKRDSRNGAVLVAPWPVTTLFQQPTERVMFWPQRDANPFFHLMESLWMLAGRNDVAYPAHYVARMRDFSDDGRIFHGAYGFRWRNHFDVEGGGRTGLPDQLGTIARRLRDDPTDRRCVLAMWDPAADLDVTSKDLPCNTHIYFGRDAEGRLDMQVNCRSNDAVLGALGANVVHMSVLQEYIAAAIGCPVGRYWQVSFNYHAYVGPDWAKVEQMDEVCDDYADHRPCPYARKLVEPFPLVNTPLNIWEQDLLLFMEHGPITGFRDAFFSGVATPMYVAHAAFRKKDWDGAFQAMDNCRARDWQMAGRDWLNRRAVRAGASV